MAVHRAQRVVLARRELPRLLHQLGREAAAQREHGLDGHVFPEGDEPDLVVAEDEAPFRVEHLRPHPDLAPAVQAVLAIVVAEEEVDAVLGGRGLELRRHRGHAVEEERQRGFRPHHEPRALGGGATRQLEMAVHVRPGVGGVPLLVLGDRGLDEADPQPPGLGDGAAPAASAPCIQHERDHGARGQQREPCAARASAR